MQLLDDGKDDNNNDDDDDDNVDVFVTVVTVIALAGITLFIRGCYIQRYYSVDRYRRERFESHCLVHRINAEPMRLSFTVHPADSPGPFVGGSPSQASKLEQPRWPTGRLAIL